MLTKKAYAEAKIEMPYKHFRIPLFPKRYLDNFNDMSFEKTRDFNFIGLIRFHNHIHKNRLWILDFAKQRFTEKSYFRLNSNEDLEAHELLGDFDYTFSYEGNRFVDKYMRLNARRYAFDKDYFGTMCSSEFTLCPVGDQPYSDRFFETIMSKSIPILEKPEHCGLYKEQRDIGYKFYLLGDDYVHRQDWVDYNYDLFLKTHTLYGGSE